MIRIKLKGIDVLKWPIKSLRFNRLQNHFIKGQNGISPYFYPKVKTLHLLKEEIHGYSLCTAIDERKEEREKKRKERKGRERVMNLIFKKRRLFQDELKSLESFQAINLHSRGLKLFIL